MRKFYLLVIALGLILDGCGGGLNLTMKPGKGFKVKSSVEVESNGYDPQNMQQKIERALFENGVDIGSPLLSQVGGALPGKTADSVSVDSSASNGREEGSVYLLEFTYNTNYTFSGVVITDFSATVFNGGEIVGMMSYHGGQTTADKLAENVGKKLAEELK